MTIAEAWQEYKKLVVPPNASADMEQTIRYTFYCGVNFALKQPPSKTLMKELEQFLEELKKESLGL